MGKPARVLLVGEENDEFPLEHNLKVCGWDCYAVRPTGRPGDAIEPVRPDVVILNLLSDLGRSSPSTFVSFARALKTSPSGQHTPVMMVGERRPEHTSCALDAAANADVDDVMLRPVSSVQIASRLKALTRLKTMHEELVRRLQTTARYGIDAPSGVPRNGAVDNAEALIVGATADHALFETALASNVTLTGALTHDTAFDYVDRKRFDIIIVNSASSGAEAAVEFCTRCRADSRLYNTPIIIVAQQGEIPDTAPIFASGVTDLLETPLQPEELKVRVMALVREVRFRESLRRVYREFRHLATGDALSGLYTRGFALEHMRSLIEAGRTERSIFSAIYGRIENIREVNTLYGFAVGDRIIRQVGELIGLLMRGEDLSARYRGAAFLTLLPETGYEAARVAMTRVRGVVNHTEFTIPEVTSPIPVVFATGLAEYDATAGPEDFVSAIAAKAMA